MWNAIKADEGDKSARLFKLCDYFECFLIFCFLGWGYESVWCCMIYHHRGFINRGFLFGPWLPIYGIGFFIILGVFRLMKIRKPTGVFAVGTIVATISELVASYIIDATVGAPMWDYHGYFMNFDGRIALEPSIMFGLIIWLAVCVIHPAINRFQIRNRANKLYHGFICTVTVMFFVDLLCRIWYGSNCIG